MYRYQKIESKVWHDEKFKTLSDDAKFLFIYFLTSPHSNILGVYVLPKQYIVSDLKWSLKRLLKPFAELLKTELCFYDEQSELLLITNHLKHNPIENPNQAKSAEKTLEDLPKSTIFQHLKLLDKLFLKPLAELLGKRYGKPEESESTEEGKGEYIETVPKTVSPEKMKFCENVFLTNEEYEQLKEKYGPGTTERALNILDNYKGAHGKKYKSDFRAILSWAGDKAKEQPKGPPLSKTQIEGGRVIKTSYDCHNCKQVFTDYNKYLTHDCQLKEVIN